MNRMIIIFNVYHMRKLEQVQQVNIYFLELFQYRFELRMINFHKIVIQEASAVIEDVIIGLQVKSIAYLVDVAFFYLVFDRESHVAEWKIDEFFNHQPITVISSNLQLLSVISRHHFQPSKLFPVNFSHF